MTNNKPNDVRVSRELLPCKCGNAAEHFKFEGANFYGCRVCGKAYGKAEEWNASTVPPALPDRKSAVDIFSTYGLGECAGWNACLAAVAETVRLEQAATESWRDAFFALHDQMGELKAAQPATAKVDQRLTEATAFVQKLCDAASGQPSVATGYLSDILDVLQGRSKPNTPL